MTLPALTDEITRLLGTLVDRGDGLVNVEAAATAIRIVELIGEAQKLKMTEMRERCAKEADKYYDFYRAKDDCESAMPETAAEQIAAAIRALEVTP